MIVLTLGGESKRFFDSGYSIVKYKLEFNGSSIIENILNYIPRESKLLLILNSKFKDLIFFNNLLKKMNFNSFKVVEIERSRGQYDSLLIGLELAKGFYSIDEPLTIYNGDTIRKLSKWEEYDADGYIEVFEGEGNHWSFVDNLGKVSLVTEKQRISDYCSSGFYFFKRIEFINLFKDMFYSENSTELYIAPYYNYLIRNGLDIKSGTIDISDLVFCGTPNEYKLSIKNFKL